jgi:hypothetical protein
VHRIALVDETGSVSPLALERAATALQIQLDRDLALYWGVHASLVISSMEELNPGLWPLRIVNSDQLPDGSGGIHLDELRRPYALVAAGPNWTVAASHELMEMVVDPYGNRFIGGPSANPVAASRAVYYLVEVCDPCESVTYTIDGTRVSNFVLPAFYDRVPREPLDLLGRIVTPLQILPGGYLSWYDPEDGAWHQALPDGTFSYTVAAGPLDAADLRGHRDRSVEGSRHDLRAVLGNLAPPVDSKPGDVEPDPQVSPTFVRADPRKDALDVIKPKEREVVGAPPWQQLMTTHPASEAQTAGAAAVRKSTSVSTAGAISGGRAFIRPEERPEVGRPPAQRPQLDQSLPNQPDPDSSAEEERPEPQRPAAQAKGMPRRTRRATKAAPPTTKRTRHNDST